MDNFTLETEDATKFLLELAANDDVAGFKQFIDHGFANNINVVGQWYGRKNGSKHYVLLHRTPLMVASTYGSIDVAKFIISFPNVDLNKFCGIEKTTALHCAASGGALKSIDVVKLLLKAGADPTLADAYGYLPIDVIIVPPKLEILKSSLEELLSSNGLRISTSNSNSNSNSNSPPLSPENGSPTSLLDSNSSPDSAKINEALYTPFVSEKKEYPIDPNFPGITNSLYMTDEFRMFSFKVKPCSRAYSHDWTECPFVHPGENARRRDPRKYHYSCVPCPDFKKGACRRGDMCEYAHGVFESWLHPAQYRTRICKDGIGCNRRVCFFAHTQSELRPLYAPSPMDANAMSLFPDSPSSPFTPPTSPSVSMIASRNWALQKVPALNLPASNFQSSRLRSSLNARDMNMDPEDLEMLAEFDMEHQQYLNELARLSQPQNLSKMNLDDVFAAESSSPRAVFSPTHKSAMFNQFQQHKNMLSPINTGFSPKSPFAGPSPGRVSPQRVDPISPMGPRVSMLRDKQPVNFRSLSSRDLGSSSAAVGGVCGDPWANFRGNASGEGVFNANDFEEFGKLRKSSSFQMNNNFEEPDIGWVHSLVKETPNEMQSYNQVVGGAGSSGEGSSSNQVVDPSVFGAWLDQVQLNQLM